MASHPLRFAVLLSAASCMPADAAAGEPLVLRLEQRLNESAALVTEGRPVYGRGDVLSGRVEREITLSGDAEVRRAGTVVRGARITYYPQDDEVVAVGDVRIVREGNVFTGTALRLKIDTHEGVFSDPSYYLPVYGGRGRAAEVEFLGPERAALRDATYTTCRPERPAWYLHAESLTLDEGLKEGSGRSGSLIFKDRKVLGVPFFAFPLGDERRSGVLAPSVAVTSNSGLEVVVPYYWNIAPNRDFTLYPRVMQRRGVQFGGQYRFLEQHTLGDLRFEYTPRDALTQTSRDLESLQQTFWNVAGWSGSVNMKRVSDDDYFVDYSKSILASSERSLPRDVLATRGWRDWSFLVRATRYQNILDARLAPPYERLPQVQANWVRRDIAGLDAEVMLDATAFSRPLADTAEGLRLVAHPRISYPVRRAGWFIVPKFGIHMSSYRLDANPGQPTSLNRAVPVFSLDSGLVFERRADIFGRDMTQTLEPRLFYAHAPYRDQSAFPVFDSGVADFNFAQLFSENTFLGNDRIADVNQLTAALVSRLIEPESGGQKLRFALGERFYFSSQKVTIPGVPARTDTRSDMLLAASAQVSPTTSFDGGLQYSQGDGKLPRLSFLWRYLPPDGRILNAGVRYLSDEIGQVDGSWRWPLAPQWMALGRINYSWLRERLDPGTGTLVSATPGVIEGVLGFEYNADCWTTRFVMHRFITADGKSTSSFFIQLELNGLARIGTDPFDILRRNIPGYRLPLDNPKPPSRYFGYE